MAYECSVVGDLLPLYLENMVGDETKVFVEAHLAGCPSCRAALKKLEMPVEPVPAMAAVPLKKLKNKLKRKWVQVAAFTTVLVAALLVSAFAILTAPRYFPYMDGLVQVSESEGGKALVTFGEGVTGYTLSLIHIFSSKMSSTRSPAAKVFCRVPPRFARAMTGPKELIIATTGMTSPTEEIAPPW